MQNTIAEIGHRFTLIDTNFSNYVLGKFLKGKTINNKMSRIFSISPFEQFEILNLITLNFGGYNLSFTNSTIFMFWTLGVYLVNTIFLEKGFLVPTLLQALFEVLFLEILNMVYDNMGKGQYLPLIWTLFSQVTLINLIGINIYAFTPTAHIIISMGLSVSIFLAVIYLGFENYGFNYFAMIMPGDSPMGLAIILVMIEFVSQLAKAVSLGVRLAANITAGHLLFAILSGFTYIMVSSDLLITVISIFPLLIIIFITVLEIAVAIIQAYVFSILTAIYIQDALHIH